MYRKDYNFGVHKIKSWTETSLFALGKVLNFFPVGGERECQPSSYTAARAGICLNQYDCHQRDGRAAGDCAHGLGVCCVSNKRNMKLAEGPWRIMHGLERDYWNQHVHMIFSKIICSFNFVLIQPLALAHSNSLACFVAIRAGRTLRNIRACLAGAMWAARQCSAALVIDAK
ncbi:unnamed protein product [Diatraea saccharalis]|uniref:Uncharacterized protein n=1 Tax=Diatraea saccharalis TaxID=40085 RepID=A0A9N9R3Y6_9NEOP|nr:unnamed protein product [Diatraea saccharalis]